MAKQIRVLVVDDDTDVRETIKEMLAPLGLAVSVATGARQALEMCEDGCPYDVVLTDVVMPEIGGTRLAEMLRQQHPTLPIVLMTGRDSALDRVLDEGVVPLVKPFTAAQLWRVVEELTKGVHR